MIMLARRGPYTSSEPTRAIIRAALTSNPYMTKSELKRATGLAWGTIYHHVRQLERLGELRQVPQGNRSLFVLTDAPSSVRPHMRLLRLESCQELLQALRHHPGTNIAGLSTQLDRPRQYIVRYLRPLIEAGVVERSGGFRGRFRLSQQHAEPSLGLDAAPIAEDATPLLLDNHRIP